MDNKLTNYLDDGGHDISYFSDIKEQITSRFKGLLTLADEKITEIVKHDKRAWQVIDDSDEVCAKELAEIERIRDEEVCYIMYIQLYPM